MKRLFTLAVTALLLGTAGADAQTLRKTWDFREGFSSKTINALKADQEEFGPDKYWRNYESDATKADEQHFWDAGKGAKNSDGYAITHNGGQEKTISELEGLELGFSAAKKFVITYNGAQKPNNFESEGGPAVGEMIPHGNSYVWLNGKNETIKFLAAVNQNIRIGVESHAVSADKLGEARGISLAADNGTLTPLFEGNPVPTYYTEYEWTLTGNEGDIATLTLKSTNGCHIYFIIVGEGDDPNANKTKVAYITSSDDAETEAAYQAIASNEDYLPTAIAAATLTEDQLKGFDAIVISPLLPADNPGVATLKNVLPFYPIVNLNAFIYDAWGYGQGMTIDLNMALIQDLKSELLNGFVAEEDYVDQGEGMFVTTLAGEGSTLTGVKLGQYFEGDAIAVVDGMDSETAVTHVHNPYHNAYIFTTFADNATSTGLKLLYNAIEMAKSSKSEVTKTAAPKIKMEYKNLNTNITLSMASSNLPKSHIYYTLDGSEPTEQSTEYTDVINVTSETVVKAVAIAEGYLLSDVAQATASIFEQPAAPEIASAFEDGKTIVTLQSNTEGADIWYNFTGVTNDTVKSMKYVEPLTIKLPTDLTAFAVTGGQVFSEPAIQRIIVKNTVVRQDVVAHFDANNTDWVTAWDATASGSTVYYFTWGKNARSIYNTDAEPIGTKVDPETGDETNVYPEHDYSVAMPADEEGNAKTDWKVMSKGQVMIWQSLSAGSDPGNPEGYNLETTGDILSYAKTTNNDIQFGGKASGERCTGIIQSIKKFVGPFDVVTHLGTSAGGDNVAKLLIEVSKDSLNWEVIGDTLRTSTVKRLWKTYTNSYDGTDEVFVRICQTAGGSGAQVYDLYVLNEGEASKELKAAYDEEFTVGIDEMKQVAKASQGIFNLNGMRRQSMQRGLNIVVNANGTVKKVLVK